MASDLLKTVDEHTKLAGHNRLALLLFHLSDDEQLFGINVFKVREVIQCPPLTNMPGMHAAVRGCADIRGTTVSVVDLGQSIGLPRIDDPRQAYLIVSEFNRAVQGFLVKDVDELVHRDGKDVLPPPSGTGLGAYVSAVTRVDGALVSIVDVEQVMEVVGESMSLKISGGLKKPEGSRAKVLIADDSVLARKQLATILEQLNIEYFVATNGIEALDMLRGTSDTRPLVEEVSMLISDIEMPGMDGYALTSAIRETEELRHLYVILHTSLSGGFNEALTEKVGANRFIAKFDAEALAEGVIEGLRVTA